jgi:hypothetical protein
VPLPAVAVVPDLGPLTARACIHANDRVLSLRVRRVVAADGQIPLRHPQRDGVHVRGLGPVDAGRGSARDQVQVLEGPQCAEIEDAAQVDVETLPALTSEHVPPARQVVDRLRRQHGVVRRATNPHVDRRAEEAARELLRRLAPLHPSDRVRLRTIPRGVGDLGDRAGVVQERIRIRDHCREPEPVGDVVLCLTAVGDDDLVEHIVAELVEIRAALGDLGRNEVRNQRDSVRLVRADEDVGVRVVGYRVLADLRRFAVRRHALTPSRRG